MLILAGLLFKAHMGRGDKKSKKGKISKGSYGVSRNRQDIKTRMKRVASKKTEAPAEAAAPAPAKAKRTVKKKSDA